MLRAVPVVVALVVLLAIAARHAIGETLEGAAFSNALGVCGGLALGSCLIVALSGRVSRA
jgi:hypothetical protein